MRFDERYGPWAVIAGASEGTGRAFAQALAARGVPSILIARRPGPLAEVADNIRDDFGVECVTASIDLADDGAFEQIRDAVADRDVGLYISNAGADPNGAQFLEKDIETWISMINRNLVTTLRCVHHFAAQMRQRGRGGLLLVGSGAGYGGGRCMATYSGAKAFDLCFSESLWAELKPCGVDVLHLSLTTTDTPAFHQLLKEKGKAPPKNLAAPERVAEVGLNHLDRGPVYNWGQRLGLRAGWRRARTRLVSKFAAATVFGDEHSATAP